MIETKWLAARFSRPMLNHLAEQASERKLRLFAVACCRRIWPTLHDERSRHAVELAEQYADGLINLEVLRQTGSDSVAAFEEICRAQTGERDLFHPLWRAVAAFRRSAPSAVRWACLAAMMSTERALDVANTAESVANSKDLQLQCELLREVFGNPFRPMTLGPAHRTPTIVSLARAAYDERHLPSGELDPQRLAVLSDALEEAGAPAELTAHLRAPGPHVRGCHVVDLILGMS